MKPSFHHRLVNGPFDDPCLYLRLLREKRAFMFDIGTINRLDPGDILKITDIFVTHTHIDHFIGFDVVVRALLGRHRPLSIFGPAGIIDCIEGKLKGYTWNLIDEYPFKLEVFCIDASGMQHASFYAENRFRRLDRPDITFSDSGDIRTILKDVCFKVNAVGLKHDIQCLGFSLEEDFHINIDKAALLDMGLPVGPWLSELKQDIRKDAPDDKEFMIAGKPYRLKQLRGIATITKGQKLSYIVDAAPDEENIEKTIKLVRNSDTLYCEAYFLDADRERAVQRNHLTAKLAGRIAREGGVKNLVVMHFSPKYRNTPDAPVEEAMKEWKS